MNRLKELFAQASDNLGFLLMAVGVVVAIVVISKLAEVAIDRAKGETKEKASSSARLYRMTRIAMLAAVGVVLMVIGFPLPIFPAFYKLDFANLPALIGGFAMGPVAGVYIEFIKVFVNLFIDGTDTAFVGEFANFCSGCCYVVPASIIYYAWKKRKAAVVGLVVGTVSVVLLSCFLNVYLTLPAYAEAFHMDINAIIGAGADKNASIHNMLTFVLFAVAPFNLLKYGLVAVITFFLYKKIRFLLKK